MSKLAVDRLVGEVQDELVTFLQSGTIAEEDVVSTLDFTDLEIDDFARLKRIHFCLSDPVVDFVEKLPERVRSIKTANQRERVHTRGEIRGSIDWNQTTKLRHTDSYGDRTVFACESPYVEYDIPENLVLKRLLWVVHRTVERELASFDYAWRREQWSDDQMREFRRLYSRNVHLNRIRDGTDIDPSARDLTAARTSRELLYTEAYDIYDTYRQLQSGQYDDPDVQSLLRETLVVPERLPRLFELFCVFKLIRLLSRLYPQLTLQVIEPGSAEVARLESETLRMEVYHDQQGNLQFHEPLDDIEAETPYFRRYQDVLETHVELMDVFLDRGAGQALYSGRPDIVVEVYEKETDTTLPRRVLLGEIKYTESEQTFARGLRELLEYTRFARIGDTYLHEAADVDVGGLLITDGVEAEDVEGGIRHLTASDIPVHEESVATLLK
ncbi:hypothetical protein [Halostella salina]|uniref:hypothetical protein n=1 Tax=Halostella salina TaxID=1547897 RepID=UPI000EF7FBF2|nr:hypothetical protein [Halostella salina]